MLMNLKDILSVANEHNFAIPAFNTSSNMILTGVMEACEKMQSPVIIAIHPDELHFVKHSFMKAAIDEANNARNSRYVSIWTTAQRLNKIAEAIHCGYSSVMIDASVKPFEENVAICKKGGRGRPCLRRIRGGRAGDDRA